MKILIVSTHDNRGGAAKAAYRFSKEFVDQGHNVCLYVRNKKESDYFIKESNYSKFKSKLLHFLDFAPGYVLSGFNKDVNFTLGIFGESLSSIIKEFNPDVINIHWTWKGFVSFFEICRVSKEIPVIWTMHDYSPFSGGIFYSPHSQPFFIKILSKINSLLRHIALKGSNITFVSPSNFVNSEFKKYKIGSRFKSQVINNGINKSIFNKKDKKKSREEFSLKQDKKYILFGAVNMVDNKIKGGEALKSVLNEMEEYLLESNIGLVSFGSSDPFTFLNISKKIETKFVGYVNDEKMVGLFSSTDLMLVPSLYENYPFVVMEAISCSNPVVAFNTGGIPEMIEHKKSGYLARLCDIKSFAEGIKYCLENSMTVNSDFSIEKKGLEYVALFNNCLKGSR